MASLSSREINQRIREIAAMQERSSFEVAYLRTQYRLRERDMQRRKRRIRSALPYRPGRKRIAEHRGQLFIDVSSAIEAITRLRESLSSLPSPFPLGPPPVGVVWHETGNGGSTDWGWNTIQPYPIINDVFSHRDDFGNPSIGRMMRYGKDCPGPKFNLSSDQIKGIIDATAKPKAHSPGSSPRIPVGLQPFVQRHRQSAKTRR